MDILLIIPIVGFLLFLTFYNSLETNSKAIDIGIGACFWLLILVVFYPHLSNDVLIEKCMKFLLPIFTGLYAVFVILFLVISHKEKKTEDDK